MSRAAHILALLALLAYCSPVRSCVLQEWTTGSSCHDRSGDADSAAEFAVEGASHGCASGPEDGHADNCLCEQPKLSAGRAPLDDVPVDPGAFLAVAVIRIEPITADDVRAVPPHPPDAPPPARSLPLLN